MDQQFKVYDTNPTSNLDLIPPAVVPIIFDSIKIYYTLPLLNSETGYTTTYINIPVQQTTVT
jgi:hypothetical protein